MWLHAPFDSQQIDWINRLQAGVIPSPVHPHTCPSAHDGLHAFAGGYLGVLVAQRRGLVCPTCGHTQGWIGRAALACAERESNAALGAQTQRLEKMRQRALDDFTRLVRGGSLVAQSMVDSLNALAERRGSRADAAPPSPRTASIAEALAA